MSIQKLPILIVNTQKVPYTMLSNEVVQNINDPFVLAIWCYLSSLPTDWKISQQQLKKHFNIGRNRLEKIMASFLSFLSIINSKR